MTGTCRMGSLAAPVNAQLRYNADTNEFYGQFMDGAEGIGVDIVGDARRQGLFAEARARRDAGAADRRDRRQERDEGRDVSTRPKSGDEMPVVSMGFTRKEVITGSIAP